MKIIELQNELIKEINILKDSLKSMIIDANTFEEQNRNTTIKLRIDELNRYLDFINKHGIDDMFMYGIEK